MVASSPPTLTFLSDFGEREYYVAAVKGVILGICPEAQIVDVSHQVQSHDLLEAAFTLSCAAPFFPPRTVHLVVVDPGVGSSRRLIVAKTDRHQFVSPDNGVLSLVQEESPFLEVFSIEADHYFRHPVSPTFHGRDVLAPVAGQLLKGLDPAHLGPTISDMVLLKLPRPRQVDANTLEGSVLHIDKFGNLITSIRPSDVTRIWGDTRQIDCFELNQKKTEAHVDYYQQGGEGSPFSIVGSSGYFELAALRQPAARLFGVGRGATVRLIVQ